MIRRIFTSSLLLVIVLAGCHKSRQAATQASPQTEYTVYHMRGKVMATDPASGAVTVNSDAIPGFMGAMVMPYKLKDPSVMNALHPGDIVTADVLVPKVEGQGDVVLDNIVIVGQARPDYVPKVVYHVPSPGDVVPDFALRNEDGRAIHLRQFRGQELLITFIYTQCPLPNFCPLVTHNFAEINRALEKYPVLYRKTHLLSVSFDTERDTPARLKSYGEEYIGSGAKTAFEHWDFAVGQKPVVLQMAQYFDVGLSYGPNDTITHTLSTTLIGANGKVVEFYHGNDWTPQQVLADMKKAAAGA
ncbi:MAG TPA: SCO family protein [Terracidiphilus sp.]|nr:SCO family protein [Terracidiphilus sp.]